MVRKGMSSMTDTIIKAIKERRRREFFLLSVEFDIVAGFFFFFSLNAGKFLFLVEKAQKGGIVSRKEMVKSYYYWKKVLAENAEKSSG